MAQSYGNYEDRPYETDDYSDDPNIVPYETKEVTRKYIVTPKSSREGFLQTPRRNKQMRATDSFVMSHCPSSRRISIKAPMTAPAAVYQFNRRPTMPATSPLNDRYLQKRSYVCDRKESDLDLRDIQERYSSLHENVPTPDFAVKRQKELARNRYYTDVKPTSELGIISSSKGKYGSQTSPTKTSPTKTSPRIEQHESKRPDVKTSSLKHDAILNEMSRLLQALEQQEKCQQIEIDDSEHNKLELAGSKCNLLEQDLSAAETEGSKENLNVGSYQPESDAEDRYYEDSENLGEEQPQFANPGSVNTPSLAGSKESEHTLDEPECEKDENKRGYVSDRLEKDNDSYAGEGNLFKSKTDQTNNKFVNELVRAKSLLITLIDDKLLELENRDIESRDLSGGDNKSAANFPIVQNGSNVDIIKKMRKQYLQEMASLVNRMSELDTALEKYQECATSYRQ